MRLYEIGEGEGIQIIAKNASASLAYDAVVAMSQQEFLFVNPIIYDGKVVNFQSDEVTIDVVYVGEDGKPLIWEKCNIKNLVYGGKKYHVLYSKRDGMRLNRRGTYRQYLGVKGTLQIDETREIREVIVKDVSEAGVGFVCEDMKLHVTDIGNFHLNFQDKDSRLNVQLRGKVVREEDVDETRRVFGAVVKGCNIPLGEYVAKKQKDEIARRRLR